MIDATWHMLVMLGPWLLLGSAVAGVLHVMLPPGLLSRHLTGTAGVFKAVGVGVPLPLCSCGVIPAGLGLKQDGAEDGPAIAFLISTPQTGVDSILVSAGLLGWPFALYKVAAAIVMGVAGGLGVQRWGGPSVPFAAAQATHAGPRGGLRAVVEHGLQIIRSIWGWLVIGIVGSAAITVLLPPSVFAAVGLSGPWAPLLVLLVALPLYVCAVASVPLAAGLVAAGMPVSAALVFLMAGPATNLATMGAIARAFGRRVLGLYLGVLVGGSLLAAWLFEVLLPGQSLVGPAEMEHTALWEVGSAWVLLGLIVCFAADDLRRRLRTVAPATVVVSVDGMTCGGCVRRLEGVLAGLPGVDTATVQLTPGQASVSGTASASTVRSAIEGAGFSVPATPRTAAS